MRSLAVLLLIAIGVTQNTTTFSQEQVPVYPAEIKIVSQETTDDGRFHIRLGLSIDDGVALYANPVGIKAMAHAATRVAITDDRDKRVLACVDYPGGSEFESEIWGDYQLYRRAAEIDVWLKAKPAGRLKISCRVTGYHEQVPQCFGTGVLETTLAPATSP